MMELGAAARLVGAVLLGTRAGSLRSVGGIRASIYNAMPLAGVEALAEFMKEFKATRG